MEGSIIQYTGQKTVLRNTPDKISEVSPGFIFVPDDILTTNFDPK